MLDKILATISLLMLIAFMGTVIGFVKEINLTVVVVIVLAMAIYDFWRTLKRGHGSTTRSSSS